MSLKDKIRSATLGATNAFRKEIVEVNGSQIEVRQLSIGERNRISAEARKNEDSTDPKRQFGIRALLCMCYEPGTDTRIYDETDLDVMLATPAGGWVDTLLDKCIRLLNVGDDAAKNSEATTEGN